MHNTKLLTESHASQNARWPQAGRVILAQFDADSVVVYQAYRPAIGDFASQHGYFGGEFSQTRMTWIKPNFLWMMYRSGWGTKEGQEVILAIRLKRTAFDQILSEAVHSSFKRGIYANKSEWQQRLAQSDVRLQWDPDHGPAGNALERRAIQLGLRGRIAANYMREWILNIEDISSFVHEQRERLVKGGGNELVTPCEHPYPVEDSDVSARLGVD